MGQTFTIDTTNRETALAQLNQNIEDCKKQIYAADEAMTQIVNAGLKGSGAMTYGSKYVESRNNIATLVNQLIKLSEELTTQNENVKKWDEEIASAAGSSQS